MAAGLHNPASICYWPLSNTVNNKSYAAVHFEFIRSRHTWRHNEYLWLTSSRFCLQKKWCGFSLSLAQLTKAISSSPISSDVLLSDATIVFVLDIVLALIINCSNYSGPYPSLWKQCVEQEKPVCTQALTQRPTVWGSTGERINSLIKCSLYVFHPQCTLQLSYQCAATVCIRSLKSGCANETLCSK